MKVKLLENPTSAWEQSQEDIIQHVPAAADEQAYTVIKAVVPSDDDDDDDDDVQREPKIPTLLQAPRLKIKQGAAL